MEAYGAVYFLITRMIPGSAAAFEANSLKFILMKNSEGSVKLVYCSEGEVREEKFRFREDEANRVANEIVMRLSEISGAEVKEVNLLKQADFSDCVPKKREERPKRPGAEEVLARLQEVERPFSFIPLIAHGGRVLGFVPEGPAVLPGEWKEPVIVDDVSPKRFNLSPDEFANLFAYFKLDVRKDFSLLSSSGLLFFSAFHVDQGLTGNKVMWRSLEVPERKGKFVSCTASGKCHFEELNYLTYDRLQPGSLNFSWFVKEGNSVLRLGGITLRESERAAGLMTRSLFVLSRDGELDLKTFSSVTDFFINNVVSKYLSAKELKEFIVLTSNPNYLDSVTSTSPSSVKLAGYPWTERTAGKLKDRETLFSNVLNTLKSIGYFKVVFL